MANKTTVAKSKTEKFEGYANLTEAAHDLDLKTPNDCLTLASSSTTELSINVDDIIYMRLIDGANLTASNEVGYCNITGIADVYTWENNKVNHYLIKGSDDPNNAAAIQSLKNLALQNLNGDKPKLRYCRVDVRDLFFSSHNDGLTFHHIDGKCDYLDYKGYLIECDHINQHSNSTDAISPIYRWTELKKLVQPDKIDSAAQAFWQYSHLEPSFGYYRLGIHNRVAMLAYAIGYINSYIVRHLSNIYDNSNIDQIDLSAGDIINDLIGIGILGKEQISSVDEPDNPDLQVGYECIADMAKINFFTSQETAYSAAWINAFNDNVAQFYIDGKLIQFDLITNDNVHNVMPVTDYRLADVLVDGLHDYLLRTTSEPVKQYLDECDGDISVYELLETISGEPGFFPSDGDMALFHNCVTKYIIDTGYLTRYMKLLFVLSKPVQNEERGEYRMDIAMLRCETIKYLMANIDWITSIYDFDDAIMPIVDDYGELNLGGAEWTVPYEYNLRRNFIAKLFQINDQRYISDLNQRVSDCIGDPSEDNSSFDIVYMDTLE